MKSVVGTIIQYPHDGDTFNIRIQCSVSEVLERIINNNFCQNWKYSYRFNFGNKKKKDKKKRQTKKKNERKNEGLYNFTLHLFSISLHSASMWEYKNATKIYLVPLVIGCPP